MDFMVPYKLALESYERMKGWKKFVHKCSSLMGHSIEEDELVAMREFVKEALGE